MKLPLLILILIIVSTVSYFGWQYANKENISKPYVNSSKNSEKPLDKYTFDALSKTNFEPSKIIFGEVIEDNFDFTSQKFFFEDSSINSEQAKRVSGLINIPKGDKNYPVILMFRGYVDREVYVAGTGTQRAGEVFAKNGFVTIAPDFLGYGESDNSSGDVMEERFQTYTTAITLLKSIENFNQAFEKEEIRARVDSKRLGIWGHSNGGQIAISILEITKESIPTVLWAPVSKPFPYSVLYYTDEFDDRGKFLRREIAKFEEDYDVDNYSIEKFFDRINAPVELHQGSADDSVPKAWSDESVKALEELDKDIEYFVYEGADHNLLPTGWSLAVERSIKFYFDRLKLSRL